MDKEQQVDLLIVGGGVNGVGIARDAVGRGLSVVLCEKDDLAGHTSSASSKLVHGGLRYLEHYALRLVGKSLGEREVLLRSAPHIIWPLRFVMPHDKSLRPAWMIRLGLFLYDHLDFGKRKLLQGSQGIKFDTLSSDNPLQKQYTKGFEYSDAWVQDSRLVVLNAMDAAEKGAEILTRTTCVSAKRDSNCWTAKLESTRDGTTRTVKARCLVNAAGPWVSSFIKDVVQQHSKYELRQVKGSHVVVPKIFDHEKAYIFQNSDKRIIFALPYEGNYTLIGTTDMDYEGDPAKVKITEEEVDYLCEASNRYFKQQIKPTDVKWSYSGVRPLVDDAAGDASQVTRDYILELETSSAPILSVFGGKITTYRKLAEEVMEKLQPILLFDKPAWTDTGVPLPGGDIPNADFGRFLNNFKTLYPWLSQSLALRYARAYGTRSIELLGNANSLADLGEDFGDGLYLAEVRYLVDNEWACSSEDILWRRSKLGLHVSSDTVRRLDAWFEPKSETGSANIA